METQLCNSYLEVNLRLIRENVERIQSELGDGVQLIPVLKDNAYGLGAVPVASEICRNPAVRLIAVAHVSEGLELRQAGIQQEILVMDNVLPSQVEAAVREQLTLTCGRLGFLQELNTAAGVSGLKAGMQLKIDSGLHRIGIEPHELEHWIKEYRENCENLVLTGVYSHFSDAENLETCEREFSVFQTCLSGLEAAGIRIPLRHISASASTECFPQFRLDAVRCGRRLYMDHPERPTGTIRETASWRSYITGIRQRKKGDRLGYGGVYELKEDAIVATVGVGYGDGLHRRLAQVYGPVLAGGKCCPLLTCCMDQCIIDITGADCTIGDEVCFFGYDREGNFLSSQEVASLVNSYEGCGLTSALSPRVARVYTGGTESTN